MDLGLIWYFVMGLSLAAYAVLDGFDLGVGSLHLLAKSDQERRIFLNAIGPVWDGNEVWIVIVMGGLFAGFPNAYATIFSGFYTLLMILIAALIFRACAIEFRSKNESKRWRSTWDVVFSISSIAVAFVTGLVLGNMIEGIPLNAEQDYTGGFFDFFKPYSVLVAITSCALFAMHGATFLVMKTEGAAHNTVQKWINKTIFVFVFCYLITTFATTIYMPHMIDRFVERPILFGIPLLAALSIFNISYQTGKKNDGWAFISSSFSIMLLLALFCLGTFPTIVRSTIPGNSITIANAAASDTTLTTLLIVVAIGIPLVLAYGAWIYRVFRGKVKLGKTSY